MYWNELNVDAGSFSVNDSNFENNKSVRGTIFNVHVHTLSVENTRFIYVSNSKFINNRALKFGGVIYFIGNSIVDNYHTTFLNCYFYKNNAFIGKNVYVHSKSTLQTIGNFDSTDASTVPTNFEMCGNIVDEISILSGESIPEGIMCKLN